MFPLIEEPENGSIHPKAMEIVIQSLTSPFTMDKS